MKLFELCLVISIVILKVSADKSDEECALILGDGPEEKDETKSAVNPDQIEIDPEIRPKPKKSLSIIFDDTGSMNKSLENLRNAAIKITNKFNSYAENPIENYILSVFNDPDVRVNATTESKVLLKWLNEIRVDGGGDPPEMALTGIIKALQISAPNSYGFVFTDASAKDHNRLREVIDLVQKKQIVLNFDYT